VYILKFLGGQGPAGEAVFNVVNFSKHPRLTRKAAEAFLLI